MQPDEEIEEVIDAFDNNLEEAELGSNFSDAFPWVVGIVSGLVTFLSILILILWIWSEANGGLIGGPAPTLTGWEESYRDLTGLDEIEGLDGTGVVVCVVDSGIELNHPDLHFVFPLFSDKDDASELNKEWLLYIKNRPFPNILGWKSASNSSGNTPLIRKPQVVSLHRSAKLKSYRKNKVFEWHSWSSFAVCHSERKRYRHRDLERVFNKRKIIFGLEGKL